MKSVISLIRRLASGLKKRSPLYAQSCFSRRFRRKWTSFTVASFSRQSNAIRPLFLFICSTSWLTNFLGSEAGERGFESRTKPQNFLMLPKVE